MKYMSISEVAQETGIQERTLRMKASRIKGAQKVGKVWMIPRRAVAKLTVRPWVRRQKEEK